MMDERASSNADASQALSASIIIEQSFTLLKAVGLPDLSMRRLAQELGVKPGALYWHISSKQALLAKISELIIGDDWQQQGEHRRASPASFTAQWQALIGTFRDRMLAIRDGAEVVSSSYALGLLELKIIAELIAIAEHFDVPTQAARVAAHSAIHLTIGQVFHLQQQELARSLGQASVPHEIDLQLAAAEHAQTVGWLTSGLLAQAAQGDR